MDETTLVKEMLARNISKKLFLEAVDNTEQLARSLAILRTEINREVEERNEIIAAIENEEAKYHYMMKSKHAGVIEPGYLTQEEMIAFDQIPNAMQYMGFMISRRHASKADGHPPRKGAPRS